VTQIIKLNKKTIIIAVLMTVLIGFCLYFALQMFSSVSVSAAETPTIGVDDGDGDPNNNAGISIDIDTGQANAPSSALDLLFLMAFLALLPSILLTMTCFMRIVVAMSFLRNAMGTQVPPTQIIVGIAIFLTIFIMAPTFTQINDEAYQPYKSGELSTSEAIDAGIAPMKEFMLRQVYESDLNLFISIADERGIIEESEYTDQEDLMDLSLLVVIPSFITSELKRAFLIGFLLYVPFLIVDIVVSSTLMSMGMVMLPPAMISMPFKLMLFVVVDGWSLLFESLIAGFH
jgi:flagellar biosynthetic protein FliP